jgi:hypothetical protein
VITEHNYRNNGRECPVITSAVTQDKALERLVVYELGYGGSPTRVEPTVVEVDTQVLGCQDRTVWEGSVEEMQPLVEICAWVAHTYTEEVHAALANSLAPKLMEVTHGNPFLVANISGLLIGKARLQTACLLWCDGPDLAEEAVTKSQLLRLEDLVAVVLLAKERKQNFLETYHQLGLDERPRIPAQNE